MTVYARVCACKRTGAEALGGPAPQEVGDLGELHLGMFTLVYVSVSQSGRERATQRHMCMQAQVHPCK